MMDLVLDREDRAVLRIDPVTLDDRRLTRRVLRELDRPRGARAATPVDLESTCDEYGLVGIDVERAVCAQEGVARDRQRARARESRQRVDGEFARDRSRVDREQSALRVEEHVDPAALDRESADSLCVTDRPLVAAADLAQRQEDDALEAQRCHADTVEFRGQVERDSGQATRFVLGARDSTERRAAPVYELREARVHVRDGLPVRAVLDLESLEGEGQRHQNFGRTDEKECRGDQSQHHRRGVFRGRRTGGLFPWAADALERP